MTEEGTPEPAGKGRSWFRRFRCGRGLLLLLMLLPTLACGRCTARNAERNDYLPNQPGELDAKLPDLPTPGNSLQFFPDGD